jgi:hypothetical protein
MSTRPGSLLNIARKPIEGAFVPFSHRSFYNCTGKLLRRVKRKLAYCEWMPLFTLHPLTEWYRCEEKPKATFNGKESDFCSKACRDDAILGGQCL